MAKYIDRDGLAHIFTVLKGYFSKKGHMHTVGKATQTIKAVKTWSAGSVPTLGTAFTIPNITKKTVVTGVTKKTVVTGGTTTDVPNISVTSKSIPNVTSAGSASSATVSEGVLTLVDSVAPTLGTAIAVGSASAGTAIKAYTGLTTGDSVSVTTGDSVTVGTAFTVPNVTGVGSVPSLTTEDVTVVTGVDASTGAASE